MITVIADDITGAAEIAGVCLRYGVGVSLGIDKVPEQLAKVAVVATDSRSLGANEAYNTHQQIIKKKLKMTPDTIVFKKCDSVLRGHVLTEIKALIDATGKSTVLLQPSNPITNRCIKNGVYYVDGQKIENTGFATDPDFPAKMSSVKALLVSRTSEENLLSVKTGDIEHLSSESIHVPDCESETDLVENLNVYNKNILIGGSAAFFEQFLKKLGIISVKKDIKNLSFTANYVLVSGSTHPESVAFAKQLEEQGCPLLSFPVKLLKKDCSDANIQEFTKQVVEVYKKKRKLIVRISDEIIQFENSSTVLKNRLSLVVDALLSAIDVNELFIEGGASAYDILNALSWNSFKPTEALAPGVLRMQNNRDKRRHITLKPGSYKWPKGLIY
ncbi:four-carbon acid sugar kinase family protein [Flavobacteriaceae bacterium GSB9]|nr:four-carbon acid sugar kinase family protein [Flavobacteriaceae bacterium GSB9]